MPQTKQRKLVIPIHRELEEASAGDPTIFLNFNRTKDRLFQGIRGEYYIQNCGGNYNADLEREFRSPNYPDKYALPVFCHWFFKRSDSEARSPQYRLTFLELDIGHDCSSSYFLVKSF